MPNKLICCISLPDATITSVPIWDFAEANKELANEATDVYYECCSKEICKGCIHSFAQSGNYDKCLFCNANRADKTGEENNKEIMKRVAVNDPGAMYLLGNHYEHGLRGLQQDQAKAIDLYARASELGYSKAHYQLGGVYHEGGNLKKAKFHWEAAAMAGHEEARNNVGVLEANAGNMERAINHWTIAASAGNCQAMGALQTWFEVGYGSRESIDTTLAAYNSSCVEMRSEARDASIRAMTENRL
jgi:TPR repeat protein